MVKRLTRREAYRLALHYAINERDSFADAYGPEATDPAAARAAWLADEFRRVLKERFGEITSEDQMVRDSRPGVPFQALAPTLPETCEGRLAACSRSAPGSGNAEAGEASALSKDGAA